MPRRCIGLFVVLVAIAWSRSTSAQPTVLVTGETRIELGTRPGDDHVVLSGVLRDDLGEPMGGREVHLRLSHSHTHEVLSETVQTQPDGSFSLQARVTTGDYELRATFEGDETHVGTEVSRHVDLDRADVRLGVRVKDGGRLDLDIPHHTIEIQAACVGCNEGIPVTLVDEVGALLAAGVTGPGGEVHLVVRSEDLGAPGAGRLRARTVEDEERAEAQTEVPIVRYRRSSLTLSSQTTRVRTGEPVLLTGELFDSRGPLENRAIGLFANGDDHLATVLTNDTGAYTAELRLSGDARTLHIVARFASDAPGREAAQSEEVAVEVGGAGQARWLWAALPITLCALLLLLIARRAPRRLTAAPPAPRPAPAGIVTSLRASRRPERLEVDGTVLDRARHTALSGAEVTIRLEEDETRRVTTSADGRFVLTGLPLGTHQLHISAPGFGTEETTVHIPHRGEWSGITVRLESLRDRVLLAYQRVALVLLPSSRFWEIWTNREVVAHGRGRIDREGLTAITSHVDEAYYGEEGPSEEDVRRIETGAEDTHRELTSTSAPTSEAEDDPPLR